MKKFTLFVASLFIAIGAMAQTPVLHYENITSRQELSSDDANTIRNLGAMTVIADVEITNSSNPSIVLGAVADYTSESATNGNICALGIGNNQMRYIVRATDGGWYSRGTVSTSTAKLAYTYNYANNQTTINFYTEGGTSQGSVTVTDAALSTFNGENAKFYIGGVEHTNSNGWYSAFAGTINSVDIYQGVLSQSEIAALCQPALPEGFVATPEDFVNGKVYTFVTQRGAMGASETSSNAISTAKVTADTETDYFKWTVYKSAKGNFYLYNIGKAMFLGEMSATADASVPMSENPAAVTFKTTSIVTYPIMFTTNNDGSCVANHSYNYGEGLITWNSGWTDLGDPGNGHQVIEVAELDAEILSTVETAVNAFEADNTEAETSAAFAISNQLTAAELMAKTEPTYIAIKNLSRTNNRWFVGNTGSAPYSEEEFTNDAVFVWEPVTEGEAGSYRLKKLNGDYMQTSAPKDFGTVDAAAAFTATAPGTEGTFNGDADSNPYISGSNDANLVRLVKGTNWINVQNGANGTPTYNTGTGGWTIHYVYELTETEAYTASITNAGYSTFYVPANVEIPEGVKAYYITSEGVNNGFVSLTEITGVVPANTAVVLEGAEGEYTFNVSDADAAAVSNNLLKGTFASTNVTENAYVLSNPSEGVGLYKAATKEVSHSGGTSVVFLNNAGKAYLPASALPAAAQASNGFRFGEGTTGIENVVTENGAKAIFDLTGRRVEAISAPGIYIVNGKKVLVK